MPWNCLPIFIFHGIWLQQQLTYSRFPLLCDYSMAWRDPLGRKTNKQTSNSVLFLWMKNNPWITASVTVTYPFFCLCLFEMSLLFEYKIFAQNFSLCLCKDDRYPECHFSRIESYKLLLLKVCLKECGSAHLARVNRDHWWSVVCAF